MTAKEHIEKNLPFYHITPSQNKERILSEGLRAGRCNAICTVRSANRDVWDFIIQTQLQGMNQIDAFCVIELLPEKHGIRLEELSADSVTEISAPLHTYICKDRINIDEADIIEDNYSCERIMVDLDHDLIETLENYVKSPIPNIDDKY